MDKEVFKRFQKWAKEEYGLTITETNQDQLIFTSLFCAWVASLNEVAEQPMPQELLEAKAKAFDVFMNKFKGYCFLDTWETNTKTHEKEYVLFVGDRHEYITQAEYENFNKAGMEQ